MAKDAKLRPFAKSERKQFTEQDLVAYGKKRHRRVQYLAQCFWKRWQEEIVLNLHRRHKWKTRQRCVTVGDVVLLKKEQQTRM